MEKNEKMIPVAYSQFRYIRYVCDKNESFHSGAVYCSFTLLF